MVIPYSNGNFNGHSYNHSLQVIPYFATSFQTSQITSRWNKKSLSMLKGLISKTSDWSCYMTSNARRYPASPVFFALEQLILVICILLAAKPLKSYYIKKIFSYN